MKNNFLINNTICVLIPTYNNEKTLSHVISGVLKYTNHILVVNDGSTDSTNEILTSYPQITTLHIPNNKGKGNALREGFKKALSLNYTHALTIDSDGQHFPDDLPIFINALNQFGSESIFIGSRNMEQNGVPKKSSFGNAFSNFWFWFETGIRLKDTQSGFRLYPLQLLPKNLYTNKFEFEIEVIVRSAWKGINVLNIPINIHYDSFERVTHFRPFKDFTRISILNTILVTITLLYIKPRDLIYRFKKKSFKQFIKEDILSSSDSNLIKSYSIALGTFVGIAPFWGFQTVIVLFLAVFFKWNKVLAFTFSNISFPPLIPFIIYGSLQIGSYFVHSSTNFVVSSDLFTFEFIKNNLAQYVIGSFVLATTTAIAFGVTSYFMFYFYENYLDTKTNDL